MNERLIKEECDTCVVWKDKLEGCKQGGSEKKREIERGKGKESQNDVGLYQSPWGRMITSILPFTHPLYNGRIYHTVPVHRVAFSSSEEMIWKCKCSYSLKAVPRYNLQKYPARVLQDVCLSVWKLWWKCRLEKSKMTSSKSEVGTDAQQDGTCAVSFSVCIFCLCM